MLVVVVPVPVVEEVVPVVPVSVVVVPVMQVSQRAGHSSCTYGPCKGSSQLAATKLSRQIFGSSSPLQSTVVVDVVTLVVVVFVTVAVVAVMVVNAHVPHSNAHC